MQVKMWVLGISPMGWRRVLVRDTCSLRELHGVIQVAMGWEGQHLYHFCLRSKRYGSWKVSASTPGLGQVRPVSLWVRGLHQVECGQPDQQWRTVPIRRAYLVVNGRKHGQRRGR